MYIHEFKNIPGVDFYSRNGNRAAAIASAIDALRAFGVLDEESNALLHEINSYEKMWLANTALGKLQYYFQGKLPEIIYTNPHVYLNAGVYYVDNGKETYAAHKNGKKIAEAQSAPTNSRLVTERPAFTFLKPKT